VDRPHNEFLEMWIHFGPLGALFYLGLILYIFRCFLYSKDKEKQILSLGLIAFLLSNLFSFSLPIHYTFFAIFLGILGAQHRTKITLHKTVTTQIITISLILIMIANGVWLSQMFKNDTTLAKSLIAIGSNDAKTAITLATKSLKWSPGYPEIYQHLYGTYYRLAISVHPSYLEGAELVNSILIQKTKGSLQPLLNEANLQELKGNAQAADDTYKIISNNIGFNPLFYQAWGEFYVRNSHFEEAAVIYDEFLNILPDDWKAPILSGGEMTREQRIFWKNHPTFMTTLDKIVAAYQESGQTEKAEGGTMRLHENCTRHKWTKGGQNG